MNEEKSQNFNLSEGERKSLETIIKEFVSRALKLNKESNIKTKDIFKKVGLEKLKTKDSKKYINFPKI